MYICKKYQIYISLTVCDYCEKFPRLPRILLNVSWVFWPLYDQTRHHIGCIYTGSKGLLEFLLKINNFYIHEDDENDVDNDEVAKNRNYKHESIKRRFQPQLIEHCSWACLFIFKYIMTIKRSTIHLSS